MGSWNGKDDIIVIEDIRQMLKSKAFREMSRKGNGGVAIRVYLIFLTFRRIEIIGKKGHERKNILNKDELNFTYKTAEEIYGISRGRFTRAIDLLVGYGFINIVSTGSGMKKVKSVYGLCERWKGYDQKDFVSGNPRPKQKRFALPRDESGKFKK